LKLAKANRQFRTLAKVLEQNPSKQGLKPEYNSGAVLQEKNVLEQNPSKQGLKLQKYIPTVKVVLLVLEQNPSKQGLKQCKGGCRV